MSAGVPAVKHLPLAKGFVAQQVRATWHFRRCFHKEVQIPAALSTVMLPKNHALLQISAVWWSRWMLITSRVHTW
jgi:hypothetical protein